MSFENQNSDSVHASLVRDDFMSVRETASSLGVSTTKVYKMDRINGPFKITKRGRRVRIDRADFDRYVFRMRAPSEVALESQASETSVPIAMNSNVEAAATQAAPSIYCGQRELTLPSPRPPGFIAYMSWS